jgi:hypothetical protein
MEKMAVLNAGGGGGRMCVPTEKIPQYKPAKYCEVFLPFFGVNRSTVLEIL